MQAAGDGGGNSPGRAETIRYHQELYASNSDEQSWLSRPSAFVLGSMDHLDPSRPLVVYDLGCGVGRHAVPIAQQLPAGSSVVGVDLLPAAIDGLRRAAAGDGVADRVTGVVADLEALTLPSGSADLFVGCSAVEHVSSLDALDALIGSCQQATKGGGLNCWVIGSDRWEKTRTGERRAALVEFDLTAEQVDGLLDARYRVGWDRLAFARHRYAVDESRAGEHYQLQMTTTHFLARRRR